jgi:alpha-galactosidase
VQARSSSRPLSRSLALAFVAALPHAGGCSSSASPSAPPCVDDAASRAFALGGQCLRLTSARVRSGGSWKALALSDVKVRTISPSAIALSASAPAPAEAFELTLSGASGHAIQQQGYQSWSYSGATRIPASVPRDADGSIATKAAATGDPLDEAAGVSYGAALIGEPGGRAIAIGAASSIVATTAIAAADADGRGPPTLTALYGAAREPLPPDGGATGASTVTMGELVIAASDRPNDALGTLADEQRKALPSGARVAKRPPGGWYTWNELFDKVTEADVTAHVDLVAAKLLPKGLPLLEIDDGWEVAWGDWKANTKFPAGMDGAGKAITQKGLQAGVWLAPFLVDVTSAVAKTADPALFVQGADGKPIQHKPTGSLKLYYVLDGTNPDSMKLAAEPIAALANGGFTFFKLDFLYAGAIPGTRKDKSATGTQALRAGLVELRKAMGDGAVFNACGAPIFPLLGLADSMRIGSDTAYAAASLNWGDLVFAARSTAARAYLAPMVWLDGDQTQVRDPYSLDEARVSAFVAALSGPAYALGDDLRTLPAERLALALDPTVLDLAGGDAAALPVDPLESPADSIVTSPVLDAIANPGSTGAPPPSRFTMRGKSGTVRTLRFAWTDVHSVQVE